MANTFACTLPAVRGYFYNGLALDATLPAITGSFSVGLKFDVEIPAITGTFRAVVQSGALDGVLPALSSAFQATYHARFSGKIPAIEGAFEGIEPYIGRFDLDLPALQGAFHSPGVIIVRNLQGTLPIITGDFAASFTGTNELDVSLPAIVGAFSALIARAYRRGIVMNMANHAITHYENFNFNSLAYINGCFVGADETGLFLIEGDRDIDQPINFEALSAKVDLSWKIPREAWMAYRSDGDMELNVRSDKGTPYEYRFSPRTITEEGRAKIGKGFRGRFIRFGLKNISGTRFDLNLLRIFGEIFKGKTR